MTGAELKTLTEGVANFFRHAGGTVTIGIPYPREKDLPCLGYLGAIGISGGRRGCIYVTADRPMLAELASAFTQIAEPDEAAVTDMVGEVANTVAGNSQEAFGSDFMISVPMVMIGDASRIQLPMELPVFIIPFTWREHRSFLVVGMGMNR